MNMSVEQFVHILRVLLVLFLIAGLFSLLPRLLGWLVSLSRYLLGVARKSRSR